MPFNQMKVSTKLISSFTIVVCLTIVLGIFSIYQMNLVNQTSTDMAENWMPSVKVSSDLNTNTSDFRVSELQHVLSVNEAEMKRYELQIAEQEKTIAANRATYEKLISSPEERSLYDQFSKDWATYMVEHDKIIALSRANKSDEAKILLRGISQKTFDAVSVVLTKIATLNVDGGNAASKQGDELYAYSRLICIIFLAVVAAIGVALALVITRNLMKQLGGEPSYAAAIAGSIAQGDLNVAVELKPNDQSSLLFAMKTMRDNLSNIVGQVRTGTETIATASSQIAAGNLDLSSRTEEQASSLEETASSMEELTSTVKQNADNARQANSLAMSASDVARKGGAVVAEVVGTMSAINESSRKIVDIISVIDGIAFQTNILALNAAVEAARAGEQGRGFAVVASEVRNLAQRSAAAAKEIKTLIGDSVEKVDVGAKLVDQAGATMNEIVESVKRVTDIMGEITAASQEQTAGIEQINTAITQMDEVTQQNAALVEEAAAAAESLQDQAANLSQVVSVFKVGNAQAFAPVPAATIRLKEKTALAQRIKKPASVGGVKKAPQPSAPPKIAAPVAANGGGDWEEF